MCVCEDGAGIISCGRSWYKKLVVYHCISLYHQWMVGVFRYRRTLERDALVLVPTPGQAV